MVWDDRKREPGLSRGLAEGFRLHRLGVLTITLLAVAALGSTTATVMGAPIAAPGPPSAPAPPPAAPPMMAGVRPAPAQKPAPATHVTTATPARLPGSPSYLEVRIHGKTVTLVWKAPKDPGTSPIETYTIKVGPGNMRRTVPADTDTLILQVDEAAHPHSYSVSATSNAGTGPARTVTIPDHDRR